MTTKTTTDKPANPPKFHAYHVIEGQKGQKGRWIRIGAFFAHEDGEGGTLLLDSMPFNFDGRIVLRMPKEASE